MALLERQVYEIPVDCYEIYEVPVIMNHRVEIPVEFDIVEDHQIQALNSKPPENEDKAARIEVEQLEKEIHQLREEIAFYKANQGKQFQYEFEVEVEI